MTHAAFAVLFVRRDISRIVAYRYGVGYPYRLDAQTHEIFKNFIIPVQNGVDHPLVMPARTRVVVMMFVPALITAEFLVLSAVPDLISALQTARTFASFPISVTHDLNFDEQISV